MSQKCQEETWIPRNGARDGSPGQQEGAAQRDQDKSRPIRFDAEAATQSFRF
jgi:hypothetical protein